MDVTEPCTDAPIQGSHNDVRENNQPEDDEKDMQRNGKADDDVSSIGPSASMAGSPNRIASRLRKAGSSVGQSWCAPADGCPHTACYLSIVGSCRVGEVS